MSRKKELKSSRESAQNDLASRILNDLLKTYNVDSTTLKSALQDAITHLDRKEEGIPISIFNKKLTVLESLVKYFVEDEGKTLREVASILNRNEKNLWHTYNNAKKKFSGQLDLKSSTLVPKALFSQSTSSPTETLVVYLHDELELSYAQIAALLDRNQRTVWTTYKRAKVKHAKT